MFDKFDDPAMQGFKNLEEAAEPWEHKKKEPFIKKQEPEQIAADAIVVNEPEEHKDTVIDAVEQEEKPEEEYTYDDYLDPEEEYTFDDYMTEEEPVPESAMPAPEEMPVGENAERDALVEGLCRWGAARAGAVVVVPGWGAVGLIANELYMVTRIARAYGIELSTSAATAAISSLGATFIGQTIATLVPFPPLQMPIAITVTYGIGKAVAAWIAAGRPDDFDDFKAIFERERNKAVENLSELQNLECKDTPLGDEQKKSSLTEKIFDGVSSGVDYTGDKLVSVFGALGSAVGEKLAELKAEHDKKAAEQREIEKNLPESEKSFYANARDNFDKNVEELQRGLNAAADQAGIELKEAIADTVIGKFILEKSGLLEEKNCAQNASEPIAEPEILPTEEAKVEEEILQANCQEKEA